ncbi:Copia protein [Symbiodinium microadriaticum]|uniref:Copia protein n=1 Tax=Symbiodinium microadriaticum TaxID=2951 RepID=A0A1Q9C9P9_SYMMI|nr:Copia protein [Symbiodinium microadriaticum]
MIAQRLLDPSKPAAPDHKDPFEELPGVPSEYAPTEPGELLDPSLLQDLEYPAEVLDCPEPLAETKALETHLDSQDLGPADRIDPPEDEVVVQDEEYEWVDDDKLEEEIKAATSKVELVTLRFFVGLKTKTGPDVTAGIQQMILRITQQFPLRVLHCDPGTEFTSDLLARWLPGQGVKLQTTVPTDKQGNGLAERMVGWFKSRARTLISANSLHVSLWPLAMRWAAEAYNRSILNQAPLPAFGQTVLHKLKKPAGAHKELLTRWVKVAYGAPHLTTTDGHVLITSEGNLVASKGFRTGVVDTKELEEILPPPLQEEESIEDALPEEEEPVDPVIPERCYHAVRKNPDWVIVGYSPLGPLDEDEQEATPEEEPPEVARVDDTYYHGYWEDEWEPPWSQASAPVPVSPAEVKRTVGDENLWMIVTPDKSVKRDMRKKLCAKRNE